ncbi:3-hydroxyacyl-CoA dehydrogenase/enoyl-CoA hydratase family protein [Corynebacterium pseudodiphtheriticum]|uniref:3-hydroxyacyl-CoA dehydrogenase/enoyl-CoA hydratase family protein n=1 Tax=Corynebacterium pseudodiphtheriticum TaxID=37637 RepID=UPI0025501B67|nr:3-hydroxyacyl-CoA dehydrogenase/enoyl-CoA hydratase family protein [Corynebacterium pseudodiphtheriticum]MDK8501189.1 3-hydroxyacyl-CoA dehydrogenase/enoyl-CoA hydratase family protein [Corynebacterium pseudodiphtheriticum]MDK8584574.1 3-hydroxyacyl-CoA dehydrogenase/enoyl-CoA hydratase family protein [Corynebacterium pseudodiphtheriticum]MDK8840325.1 3-hydroxyacyl-CoA dehydrogenase/enoyl-CoA hydratase family protein [Corynebacterium pseudodiphtheriticum]
MTNKIITNPEPTTVDAPVKKAAVIGAGSMGAGIAALMASAGIQVTLLDMADEGDSHEERSARAYKGIETQEKRKGFVHPKFVENISAGNTTDDLDKLHECDWVVEAIFEDLDAKRALYETVGPHLNEHALLSSNTSTIPLAELTAKLPDGLASRFAITHFFNPPRVMRLVEIVSGEKTSAATLQTLNTAAEQQLGKVVVDCRDTPGFIANRLGCFWLGAGAELAMEQGISYELADAVFSKPFGIPRTGVFGLLDYIGLQLVKPIWSSLTNALPESDQLHQFNLEKNDVINGLVDRGLTGRTGDGGFYQGRDKVIQADFSYGERETPEDPATKHKDAAAVIAEDSAGGRYARDLFAATLGYCLETAEEIADTVELMDKAMVLGYGWKQGPFALADSIGLEKVAELYDETPSLLQAAITAGGFYPEVGKVLATDGSVAETKDRTGVVTVKELLAAGQAKTVREAEKVRVHLLDNGVGILDLQTSLNSLSQPALNSIRSIVDDADQLGIQALVVGNDEHRAFSAGADLTSIAEAGESGDTQSIDDLVRNGSQVLRILRNAPFPVVGAVRGAALGGGSELYLSCDRVVVHADTKVGFPERNVGLFPAWSGTVALLERMQGLYDDYHQRAFDVITDAKPLPNMYFAAEYGFIREGDAILMSPDHVLGYAIEQAASMIDGYQPREDTTIALYSGATPLDEGWPIAGMTDNDHVIARQLAKHYTAADGVSELGFDEFADREVEHAVPLIALPANVERAMHMAKTRKPLNN